MTFHGSSLRISSMNQSSFSVSRQQNCHNLEQVSKPSTVSSRKGTCICVFNFILLSNTRVPGVSSDWSPQLCLFKWSSHVHKSSVRAHQCGPCWWQRGLRSLFAAAGLSQGGAILKNQSRARPVSFCLWTSVLLFAEWEWSSFPGMTPVCRCRCRGCCVPSCGGSSCPSPSPSDSCVSWPDPSTVEQQHCWRAACHILLWLSPLLRYVKQLTWTYGPWRREDLLQLLTESGRRMAVSELLKMQCSWAEACWGSRLQALSSPWSFALSTESHSITLGLMRMQRLPFFKGYFDLLFYIYFVSYVLYS